MICVDSSVAVKWIVRESHSLQARALLRVQLERRELIVAPPLLPVEVANILRQRHRAGTFTVGQASRRLDYFLSLPVELIASELIYRRALAIAVDLDLPAVYDPMYLAVAEAEACPFWTADEKLIRAIGSRFSLIRWIGNFQPDAPDQSGIG